MYRVRAFEEAEQIQVSAPYLNTDDTDQAACTGQYAIFDCTTGQHSVTDPADHQ